MAEPRLLHTQDDQARSWQPTRLWESVGIVAGSSSLLLHRRASSFADQTVFEKDSALAPSEPNAAIFRVLSGADMALPVLGTTCRSTMLGIQPTSEVLALSLGTAPAKKARSCSRWYSDSRKDHWRCRFLECMSNRESPASASHQRTLHPCRSAITQQDIEQMTQGRRSEAPFRRRPANSSGVERTSV